MWPDEVLGMNPELLEEILSCPDLPTLPRVAMEILERTRDPDVVIGNLEPVIMQDQGLASRMLRTVNSSLFGLRQSCSTIDRALVLLGIGPVRSLALGFSLAASFEKCAVNGFDWEAYWRRALVSAIAARDLAGVSGHEDCADEAYIAALMADIGMVAMHQALGARYDRTAALTGGDHRLLSQAEINVFEIGHADVGAHLAERWKLPRRLSLPIRFHERPTAAPGSEAMLAKLVHLGVLVHDVVTDRDARPALRTLYDRASEWVSLSAGQVDVVVRRVGGQAKELATVFGVSVGPLTTPKALLSLADESLRDGLRASGGAASAVHEAMRASAYLGGTVRDPLTGVATPEGFFAACRKGFDLARGSGGSLSVITMAIEHLREVESRYGAVARDEAVLGVVALVGKVFEPMGGFVARLGPSVLGLVVPGIGERATVRAIDEVRAQLASLSGGWCPESEGKSLPTTLAVGVAVFVPGESEAMESVEVLIKASSDAVKHARVSGGNCVRVSGGLRAA
jgi:HD-like signal output (HDOD) protein/GGDEF domain-containing protein